MIADEQMYSRWFVLAFTLLLLVAGSIILNRLRPTGYKTASWAAGGLALLLAAGAFVPYGLIWKERYDGYNAKLRDPAIKTLDKIMDEPAASYRISNYEIGLKREADDRLRVKVRLQIPAGQLDGSRELPLTLNRAFDVKEVKVDGAAAAFTHQGEALTVKLAEPAEKNLQVEMEYAGRMEDYMPQGYTEGAYSAFVKGDNVHLPWYIAWYPLAGHRSVYVKEVDGSGLHLATDFVSWEQRNNPPVDVRLNVSGFESPLFTNLTETGRGKDGQTFESKAASGIRILGGDFEEVGHPGLPVRIVTIPYQVRMAERLLDSWDGMYAYFASWVDGFRPKLDQVLFLPMDNSHSYELEDRTYLMNWMSPNVEEKAMLLMSSMLLGTRSGESWMGPTDEDVRLQIRALMWYMYDREQKGYSDEELQQGAGNNELYYLYDNPVETDPNRLSLRMAEQVGSALAEGKYRQVKEVLNYFYAQGLEIVPPDTDSSSLKNNIPYSEWEREWK